MVKLNLQGDFSVVIDDTVPKGQRRVVNKERRVASLLGTAERLIEASGTTDFTMQQLADGAGFSLATTYNLIGTKAAVLYALMDTDLKILSYRQSQLLISSPEDHALQMVALAVDFFTSKPNYYRPLMRYLLGVFEPTKRPIFMAHAVSFWRLSINPTAQDVSTSLADSDQEDVAQGLHLAFAGALDLWVHHEIDNKRFYYLMQRQATLLARPL